MPDTYTIESLGQKAVWENEQNKGDYPVQFVGDDREVVMFHDSSSDFDPPKIGAEVYGEIKKDKRGNLRFSFKPKPRGGSSSSGSGKGGGYGPEDIARITRSHSQEMAVRLIAATGSAEGLDPSNNSDIGSFLNGVVRRLADWFDADVARAEKALEKDPEPPPKPAEEVPTDREGLEPQPALAGAGDADIPF